MKEKMTGGTDCSPECVSSEKNGKPALEFHHICLIAPDYEEAVRFYVDYMGFDLFRESFSSNKNARKLELYSGGRYIAELFIKEDSVCTGVQADAELSLPGFNHLSFLAEDVEQMLGRMSEKGVPVTEVKIDRITGKKYGFCWDPTGTKIEFYER